MSMNESAAAIANSRVQEINSDQEGAMTSRRPRGRPRGSKNKPHQPIYVCLTDTPNALQSHVIEIANGADILGTLLQFATRRQLGLCILGGSGTVFNPILRHPSVPGANMPLTGLFHILHLTGSYVEPQAPGLMGLTLSICMTARQGIVVGGEVEGPLHASGPVIITAATFSGANHERLGIEPSGSADTVRASPSIPLYNNLPPNYWENLLNGNIDEERYN